MDEKGQPQPERNAPLQQKRPSVAKKYTPEERQRIRFEWETGTATESSLAKKYFIQEGTIRSWRCREKWSKDATKGEISERIREKVYETIAARMARLGMPEDKLLKLIIEGSLGTKTLKNIKTPVIDENGVIVTTKRGVAIVADKTVSVIDVEVTRRYQEMLIKLYGTYAAPKSASKPELEKEGVIPVFINQKVFPAPVPEISNVK
jgi:transposase-like protein